MLTEKMLDKIMKRRRPGFYFRFEYTNLEPTGEIMTINRSEGIIKDDAIQVIMILQKYLKREITKGDKEDE